MARTTRPAQALLVALATGLLGVVACGGGEPPAADEGAGGASGDAAAQAPEQPADEAAATSEGYVEIVVDGETHRFEFLPADDNELNELALELRAQRSADDEQGVFIVIMQPGLADLEYPHVFDGFGQEEADAGETPYRMTISYRDADGGIWALQPAGDEATGIRIDRLDGGRVEGTILPGRLARSAFEEDTPTVDGGAFSISLSGS